MTVSNPENFDSHAEALQLPLFVAGMLDQSEQEQMKRHLKQCPSCQKELEEERRLRPTIHEALETWPKPSHRVLQRAKEKIAQRAPQATDEQIKAKEASPSWAMRLEQWIRKLFLPRWVPALAILIILIQGTFLQYLLTSPPTSRPLGMEGPIMERQLPSPAVNQDHIQRIQIQFAPDLSMADVQTLLKHVQGTIILGPGADDEFVIALSYDSQDQLDKNLQTLYTTKAVQKLIPLHA